MFTDGNGDLQADPGDTMNYTVTIVASGEDATGVAFTDTVDPNTAFVGGSLTVTPVALMTATPRRATCASRCRGAGACSGTTTWAPGGDSQWLRGHVGHCQRHRRERHELGDDLERRHCYPGSDGSFSYNPPAGFEGADSFIYTLTNSAGSNTGTVTINVSGMIWFINNNAGACSSNCNGRLTNPFTSLAAFEAVNGNGGVNNPAAGDNIFIYESATAYVGPVTLEDNQKLIGQDAVGASLAALAGITLAPNSDPCRR